MQPSGNSLDEQQRAPLTGPGTLRETRRRQGAPWGRWRVRRPQFLRANYLISVGLRVLMCRVDITVPTFMNLRTKARLSKISSHTT